MEYNNKLVFPESIKYPFTFEGTTLTSSTPNWKPPTKKECERQIIIFAKKYASKKWNEIKKPYLKEIKYWVNELNKLEKLIIK